MKTPYLKSFQFFWSPHVVRRYRCHLHTNRNLRLIEKNKYKIDITEKRSDIRIEPHGTLYFNVSALEKNIINTNQKLSVWKIGLKPFNYRCQETKIFHFFKGKSWSKVSNAFWRSTTITPVCIYLSIPVATKSINWARQKYGEWFVLNPD